METNVDPASVQIITTNMQSFSTALLSIANTIENHTQENMQVSNIDCNLSFPSSSQTQLHNTLTLTLPTTLKKNLRLLKKKKEVVRENHLIVLLIHTSM